MLGTVGNKNDADLVPANIKDGVDIFGVGGNFNGQLEGLSTNIITAQSAHDGKSGYSVLGETVTDIYFIYSQSLDTRDSGSYYPYGARIWVSKYSKSTGEITNIGNIDSGTNFYTSDPYFISAYKDGNTIYINYQGYQLVGIFTVNTDTDTLGFTTNSVGANGTPHTSGVQIYDNIQYNGSLLTSISNKIPRDGLNGYGVEGFVGSYKIV